MPERPANCADRTCGLCFKCHVASVRISPSAMPTRLNDNPSRGFHNNSWEKGVATHPNGMPFLGPDLDTIPIHQWQSERTTYEEKFRAAVNNPQPPVIPPAATDPAPAGV